VNALFGFDSLVLSHASGTPHWRWVCDPRAHDTDDDNKHADAGGADGGDGFRFILEDSGLFWWTIAVVAITIQNIKARDHD